MKPRAGGRSNYFAGAGLDQLSTRAIVEAIHREDTTVARAVRRELPAITRAIDAIVHALANGGRLIYVGAGTSGRLAVLDAAECPPTFGVPARLVTAVIAGGRRALTDAAEDIEDSAVRGQRDLVAKRLTARDIVVGITASGATPYVLGALRFARRIGATTIGVTANRRSPVARLAGITIAAQTGAEVIEGSTRMKAGTAQKMILNLLSTTAMVRLGHVYHHWMVDVALTNRKLRQRGVRILQEAAGATAALATSALRQADSNLRVALVMLKTKATAAEAARRLRSARGNLRRALGE
ncbi:MAG TPA: N-acetylmuramic acid 6-phosphate etherase [Candidatus Acidoferrales bacterium]